MTSRLPLATVLPRLTSHVLSKRHWASVVERRLCEVNPHEHSSSKVDNLQRRWTWRWISVALQIRDSHLGANMKRHSWGFLLGLLITFGGPSILLGQQTGYK